MKSAKEWIDRWRTSEHPVACNCNQCRNGYERFITEVELNEALLDAMKEGARRAFVNVDVPSGFEAQFDSQTEIQAYAQGFSECKDAILATAEKWDIKDI